MKQMTFYERYIKRGFDVVLSGLGAVMLLPVFAVTAAAIFIEDPGPVIFKQKRVGINKSHFELYKFRSMRMDTPHDVPTHQLDNPDQYILKTGGFIRKYSIDELPQLINILKGDMSIVGPRPALWNQFDLIAERDRYGANRVLPGLTGWAQINGRDELEIPVKAKMDGKYARALRKNSPTGFFIDLTVLFKTVGSVLNSDGVVEGGTGAMKTQAPGEDENEDNNDKKDDESPIGFGHAVNPDKAAHKNVLITGAGSYIGEYFKEYAEAKYEDNFTISTLDMLNPDWEKTDFSDIDVIYHVAGIAHADVGHVSDEVKQKYYDVNTNLTLKVAKKAKAEGVKEFVFMSSMIVYGESAPFGSLKHITESTKMAPANFYGDSKYQADIKVRALADDSFKVAVLRPPMIYGRGSKGNYPLLAKMAKLLPVFPNAANTRSMLYIENLCEFLCQLFLVPFDEFSAEGNIFIPQNAEYTKTSDMVKGIARAKGHKIMVTKALDIPVKLAGKIPGKIGGMVNKAFGNSTYDMSLSIYEGIDYQIKSLSESIEATEKMSTTVETIIETSDKQLSKSSSKVLILVNHPVVIYNFRLELVEALIENGYEVHLSCPYGDGLRIEELKNLGVNYHDIVLDRHGVNPLEELKLLLGYKKLIDEVKPAVILGYTIKPNIYGALVAAFKNIPFIANVTGLGTAVENRSLSQTAIGILYKVAFLKVRRIYFQNKDNMQFFTKRNIGIGRSVLLPGSGVNLDRFPYRQYPKNENIKFAFISRIMKEKGIEEYLEAAKAIKINNPEVEFHVCGFSESDYQSSLEKYTNDGTIIYHGMINNVSEFLTDINAVVLPSYHEGMSNVLLEAAASGRALITTNVPGCREAVIEGVNGYTVDAMDVDSLIDAINTFLKLSYDEMEAMGREGRILMENNFSRQRVVDQYLSDIKEFID